MRVHELSPDGAQDLIVVVLHQTQLPSVENHAHLKQSRRKHTAELFLSAQGASQDVTEPELCNYTLPCN